MALGTGPGASVDRASFGAEGHATGDTSRSLASFWFWFCFQRVSLRSRSRQSSSRPGLVCSETLRRPLGSAPAPHPPILTQDLETQPCLPPLADRGAPPHSLRVNHEPITYQTPSGPPQLPLEPRWPSPFRHDSLGPFPVGCGSQRATRPPHPERPGVSRFTSPGLSFSTCKWHRVSLRSCSMRLFHESTSSGPRRGPGETTFLSQVKSSVTRDKQPPRTDPCHRSLSWSAWRWGLGRVTQHFPCDFGGGWGRAVRQGPPPPSRRRSAVSGPPEAPRHCGGRGREGVQALPLPGRSGCCSRSTAWGAGGGGKRGPQVLHSFSNICKASHQRSRVSPTRRLRGFAGSWGCISGKERGAAPSPGAASGPVPQPRVPPLPSAGQLVPLPAFCPLRGCSLFPEGSRVLGEGGALAAPAINCQLLLRAGGACAGASTGFQLRR